eukprot:Cvel_5453.t1-p1 / transcript=Cvel_5453.t1 / gene=Cvel_5453 / organism=Chromera_velia_CCMP2878 / gene_product=DNA-directed RNA polymerase III subunit rpc1, putative / transcript_product=DNA-directed RNA polymerase III subunit rpc1, putative / location=Cvel_scaffold255:160-1125(-) / protein_length=322 / sequence_SO=supercontig / SO=protein_coding / is_pseudo=false
MSSAMDATAAPLEDLQSANAFLEQSLATRFVLKEPVKEKRMNYVIDGLTFGILSAEEIDRYSEIQVFNRELYDVGTKQPFVFGCLDPRLGVSRRDAGKCRTCDQLVADCAGHFGFVKLCLPVFHVGYFKHAINILLCICKECSRLLFSPSDREKYLQRMRRFKTDMLMKKNLFKKMVQHARTLSECPYCGAANGLVRKAIGQPLKLFHEVNPRKLYNDNVARQYSDQYRMFASKAGGAEFGAMMGKAQEDLNPLRVQFLLQRMDPSDFEVLDIVDPIRVLITHVIVPPIGIRPSVAMGDKGFTEDDLTMQLSEILHANAMLS